MTLQQAMTLIQRRRPQAQPIPAFMEFLRQTENAMFQSKDRLLAKSPPPPQSTSMSTSTKPKATPILGPRALPNNQTRDRDDNENESPMKRRAKVILGPSLGMIQTPMGPPLLKVAEASQLSSQHNAEEDRSGTRDAGENGIGSALPSVKEVVIGPCLPPATAAAKTKVNHRLHVGAVLPPGSSTE
jgi:hypothetical protein